jgi:hypothetical protein
VNAEEIYFYRGEGGISNAEGDGNSGDEGTEFSFVVVGCSETYMPCLFVVGGQKCPTIFNWI